MLVLISSSSFLPHWLVLNYIAFLEIVGDATSPTISSMPSLPLNESPHTNKLPYLLRTKLWKGPAHSSTITSLRSPVMIKGVFLFFWLPEQCPNFSFSPLPQEYTSPFNANLYFNLTLAHCVEVPTRYQ